MAQLLAPVRTDLLLEFPKISPCYGSRPRSVAAVDHSRTDRHRRQHRRWKRSFRIAAATAEGFSAVQNDVADDYYAVLGLLPDATPQQIKKAYYNCMKSCHPDLSGNDPDVNNFCMFINDVYAVLSDPLQRMVYDEIHGYVATAINPFLDDSVPKDHAFVDEFSCIGCKNCANVAPDVFRIEEEYGRARVCCQSGNPDLVQQAIDSCPVDCIHWTSPAQLSLLEDEMRRVERVNVLKIFFSNPFGLLSARLGIIVSSLLLLRDLGPVVEPTKAVSPLAGVGLMLAGMGSSSIDVFRMANSRWEKRQAKVLEKAKIRMMKQKDSDRKSRYWSNIWGAPKNYETTEGEVKERAKSAAAASRRWREYSRRGADRPPTYKLPEAISNKDK